jgi:endonuclease YncB( thermonuclease family)
MRKVIGFVVAIFLLNAYLYAASSYMWTVTRVIDGDTFEVDAMFFPRELGNISVRVADIDTPEKKPRAKCEIEHALAMRATEFTKTMLLNKKVIVSNIKQDKYGGRIVATVYINNTKLSDLLITKGLAKPYGGGTKSSWCT